MLRQGLVALSLLLEQDEGVSRGPAVWLLDEENSELLVQNLARLLAAIEEVNLTRKQFSLSSLRSRESLTTCLAEQSYGSPLIRMMTCPPRPRNS